MKWAFLLLTPLTLQGDPIEKLVEQLGADDPEIRAKASVELVRLGEKAEPYIQAARKHPNAEVRARVNEILPAFKRLFKERFLRGRISSKFSLTKAGDGGKETEKSVLAALRWLARHQNADGSWSVTSYVRRCKDACRPNPGREIFDTGVTGLALLAFLGAGHSHLSTSAHDGISFGDVVLKGLRWMLAKQDEEGCIGGRRAQKYMYSHSICTLTLVEAYGLTKSAFLKEPAQRAVDFTFAAQNPGKAWRYSYKCGENDTSVTLWATLTLQVASYVGLKVSKHAFDGPKAWFDQVSDSYHRVGYRDTGRGFRVQGLNEQFDYHETLTVGTAFLRILLGVSRGSPTVRNVSALCLQDLPTWEPENLVDYYYWHFATLALFQLDGPNGASWRRWNKRLKEVLVKNQWGGDQGCRGGSWEPTDRWSGEAGRVYATALNALTLETYYRYTVVP